MPGTSGKSKGKGREGRRSRSRNTTPISTATSTSTEHGHTTLLQTPNAPLVVPNIMSYEDIVDRYCRGSTPPAAGNLKKIAETLRQLGELAKTRSENCDRGMRELSKRRKELVELAREKEHANREAEERREKTKKIKLKTERDDERLLAAAANGAPRDSMDTSIPNGHNEDADMDLSSLDKAAGQPVSPALSGSSMSSQQPRPAPAVPQYQTFGPDPSAFDDPTVYHLHDIDGFMTEEEKKAVYGVAEYPHDDLHDLTPGTPPDKDFSNAKPPNQVTSQAFTNYLEPFVKPLTEEDIAFLKERGDRVSPFIIPRRGMRTYKEIWAEEDGSHFGGSSPTSPGDASSKPTSHNIEQMSDDLAETSSISTGPMMARLLATMRPERRAPPGESSGSANIAGDVSASLTANGDMDVDGDLNSSEVLAKPLPPATYLPESSQPGWKTASSKLDYSQVDDRLMQELRYIGFVSEDAEPDYTGQNDDEVAARLRYLQDELQRVSVINSARKARILELVEERMAQQEFSTIADDLDTQLNQAYLKRHRNIGKGKKNLKRPGGPGGGSHLAGSNAGISKPSVGEPIRSLMERRSQWNSLIGPVVNFGKVSIPKQTIFDNDNMARLEARERDSWNEAQDTT